MATVSSYLTSPDEVIQGDQRPAQGGVHLEIVDEAGTRMSLSPRFAHMVVELLAALDQGKVVHIDVDEPLVSPERAGELLGVSRPTVYAWQDRDIIARVDQGSRRMVPLSDIERYQRDQEARAAWRADVHRHARQSAADAGVTRQFDGLVDLAQDPLSARVGRTRKPRFRTNG